MRFYLGTHRPNWLWHVTDVPLFVSHRVLRGRRRRFPKATTSWALDSGGFTELSLYGEWRTSPVEYVAAVRRYAAELGGLAWASPQDWMCEPWITAKTGLSVAEHQARTIANYLQLRDLAPELPFIPVLQGWDEADYHAHADAYAAAGIDLTAQDVVGVGSVCRRQATGQIAAILDGLWARGLRMHGFGVKTAGLALYADDLVSADSLAWSYSARVDARHPATQSARPGPGGTSPSDQHSPVASGSASGCGKNSCANCLHYALAWRDQLLARLATRQISLFGGDREIAS